MKKLLLHIALAALASASHAQNAQNDLAHRGYVGVSYGGALLSSGDSQKQATGGWQLGANFGYLFSEHVGVAASAFGNVFTQTDYLAWASGGGGSGSVPYDVYKRRIRLLGIVAGPLFTASTASRRFDFDLRPYIGFNTWSMTYGGETEESPSTWFAGGIGLSTRWNCWEYLSVSVNFDNMLSRPDRTNMFPTVISLGVNYRIK